VGEVLQHFSVDGQFPVYGFGGIMPNGAVSHCFPLNGDVDSPAAEGVQGMLEVYRCVRAAGAASCRVHSIRLSLVAAQP
jgi:hypothetical protein